MAKEKDLEYKVFTIRLHNDTKDWLKLSWRKSGLSWNIFIIKLLNSYETKTHIRNNTPRNTHQLIQ